MAKNRLWVEDNDVYILYFDHDGKREEMVRFIQDECGNFIYWSEFLSAELAGFFSDTIGDAMRYLEDKIQDKLEDMAHDSAERLDKWKEEQS